MTQFTIHSLDTAPEAAKPLLQGVQSKSGFIPNILGAMADAPNVLKAYLDLSGSAASGTLSPTEQQVVQITASRLNGCEYCVAAHGTIAQKQNLDADVIAALSHGKPLADAKLEALRIFTATLLAKAGWLDDHDIRGLTAAGYSQGQVLEVILSATLKYLTNTVNNVIQTPIDAAFQPNYVSLCEDTPAGGACCGGGCHG